MDAVLLLNTAFGVLNNLRSENIIWENGKVYNNKQPSGHGLEMDHTNGYLNA